MSTSTSLQILCLRTAEELIGLKTEINALNQASSRPDPFSTCEFYVNFLENGAWRLDRARSRLCFLVAFRGKQLIGYLALKEVSRRAWLRRSCQLDFLVGNEADRPHVVARPEHLTAASEGFYAYLAARRDWDFIELQQQDVTSAHPSAPLRLPGCWVGYFPGWDNCTIRLRWKTVREYFESMSRNMRSSLKRRLRALFAFGKLELIASSDPRATPALFELYCGIESRSWKSNTDIAIGRNATRMRYFEALLDAEQPMRIVIHLLLVDGIPIAGLLSGSFSGPEHKGLYGLHLAFDRRLSAMTPGSAILLMGVRYAIEHGYAFFNLLSGFGYYKTRWLAEATATRSVQIYRVGSVRFLRRLCGNLKRTVLRQDLSHQSKSRQAERRSESAAKIATPHTMDLQTIDQDRNRYDTLIEQAVCAGAELLSAGQLKAEFSFLLKSRAAITPVAKLLDDEFAIAKEQMA